GFVGVKMNFRRPIDISSLLDQTSFKIVDGKKLAVKNYTKPSGIIKWLLLNFPPIPFYYPLTLDPAERMRREIDFFSHEAEGFLIPKIYNIDWKKIVLEREYIEGRHPSFEDEKDLKSVGMALSFIHRAERCLGDTKPQNFLIAENGVYVIDAEQSLLSCQKRRFIGWDVALSILFIFWNNPLISPNEFSSKVRSFLNGYKEAGSKISWEIVREAHPLILLTPPQLLLIVRESLSLENNV
ncbi:MAG: hypothetical protein QXD85_04365, partial [Fervidicoccaceae archaeon]